MASPAFSQPSPEPTHLNARKPLGVLAAKLLVEQGPMGPLLGGAACPWANPKSARLDERKKIKSKDSVYPNNVHVLVLGDPETARNGEAYRAWHFYVSLRVPRVPLPNHSGTVIQIPHQMYLSCNALSKNVRTCIFCLNQRSFLGRKYFQNP